MLALSLGADMRRREFITLLGGTATWPLAARAQQGERMPVIGFLGGTSPEVYADRLRAFHQGLKEAGYVEGRNVEIEYLWAEGRNDLLPALAAQLARGQVAVIVAAGGTPSAFAAKAATATIPIIFGVAVDPVELGLVASLNQPGGNLTGVTNLNVEVGPKRLELLRELLPSATLIAVLVNPTNPTIGEPFVRDLEAAAHTLRFKLLVLHASTERDLDTVFATLLQQRADALVISPDQFLTTRIEQLAQLTLRHGIPAISQLRQFATAGGLTSYGSSETEYYRPVGVYTGRILNGEKPGDLPVLRSSKVELIINMKTAKVLGITFPLTLLGRADEAIE
jgi:putative tryptophan/tyrosine transport system substrate-binding protein